MKKQALLRLCSAVLLAVFSIAVLLFPWPANYASPLLWSLSGLEPADGDTGVDVFLLSSTADLGKDGTTQTSVWQRGDRRRQDGRVNIQVPTYKDSCRIYAPYYRQACLSVYYFDDPDRGPYFAISYDDARKAFLWYLEHENNGRPFILAGFSQGADMTLRLLEEFGSDPAIQDRLVAAYIVGWRVTQEDLRDYPHLKLAQGADDTGVIVSFCSEADYVTGSIIVPEGGYTYGINPLSWTTDDRFVPKEDNAGSQFFHGDGSLAAFRTNVTGCYRDQTRGVIVPVDITAEEYHSPNPIFVMGCYHSYELSLYYSSVHENVQTRVDAYLAAHDS